eukprot:SAG11_NODE_6289_length_1344_cov_0.749398_3_plen_48_part_01
MGQSGACELHKHCLVTDHGGDCCGHKGCETDPALHLAERLVPLCFRLI